MTRINTLQVFCLGVESGACKYITSFFFRGKIWRVLMKNLAHINTLQAFCLGEEFGAFY